MQNPIAIRQSRCILAKILYNVVKSRAPISSTFPVHAADVPGTTLWVASLSPHSLENNYPAEQKPQWLTWAGQARPLDLDSKQHSVYSNGNSLNTASVFQSLKISVIEIVPSPAWGFLDLCPYPLPKLFNLPLKLVFLLLGDTCSLMYLELLHGRAGLMASGWEPLIFLLSMVAGREQVIHFKVSFAEEMRLPTHPPLLPWLSASSNPLVY